MSQLQQAISILIDVFYQYADMDGDNKTLSKGELKELLQKEFKLNLETTTKSEIDRIFNDLDHDKNSSVDFKEFVTFVSCTAMLLDETLFQGKK